MQRIASLPAIRTPSSTRGSSAMKYASVGIPSPRSSTFRTGTARSTPPIPWKHVMTGGPVRTGSPRASGNRTVRGTSRCAISRRKPSATMAVIAPPAMIATMEDPVPAAASAHRKRTTESSARRTRTAWSCRETRGSACPKMAMDAARSVTSNNRCATTIVHATMVTLAPSTAAAAGRVSTNSIPPIPPASAPARTSSTVAVDSAAPPVPAKPQATAACTAEAALPVRAADPTILAHSSKRWV